MSIEEPFKSSQLPMKIMESFYLSPKMKYLFLFLICILHLPFYSHAQEMKVNSVTADITDLSAKINPRYAPNGSPCALLKITCPQSGVSFQSKGIIGNIEYVGGEYLVYLASSTKDLVIESKNNGNLNLVLSKYDVLPLQPNLVYHVFIDLINDISVDERVRLYKPMSLSEEEKFKLHSQAINIKLPVGTYDSVEEKELTTLFNKKGCLLAGLQLGSHYIRGFLAGDSIPSEKIAEGEFLLKVSVEYDENAYAAKLLGDYFYNSKLYENAFEYYFIGHMKGDEDASNCLALMMENGLGTEKDVEGALDIWRDMFWNRDNFTKAFTSKNDAIFEHFIRLKKSINTLDEFSAESIIDEATKTYDYARISGISKQRLSFIDWKKVDRQYYPRLYNTLKIALYKDASIDAAIYFMELFSRTRPYLLSSYTDMDMFYPEDLPDRDVVISKSINLIKEAASKDHLKAMRLLSQLYLDGKFIIKNIDRALEILARGSELGDADMAGTAEKILDGLYRYDEAFRFRKLAYDLGNRNHNLLLRLADNYAAGEHCEKNPQKALDLYNTILSGAIGHDKSIIEERIRDLKIENKL